MQREQIRNVAAPKFQKEIADMLVNLTATYQQMLILGKGFPLRLVG